MRNKIAIIAVAIVYSLTITLPAEAAFVSRKKSTASATAAVGGTPVVDFTLSIRDVVNPLTTPNRTSLGWSGVTSGNGWVIASQLLLVNATVTNILGGIQVYTDNTIPTAVPRFVDPSPLNVINADSNPAGLLLDTGAPTSSRALPMAWSVKDAAKTVGSADPAVGIVAADPNTGATAGSGNKFQWLYMKDRAGGNIDNNGNGIAAEPAEPTGQDTNGNGIPGEAAEGTVFVNGDPYVTFLNIDGIHFGQAPTEFGGGVSSAKNVFIYPQANFSTALPAQSYRSSTITVEAFTL